MRQLLFTLALCVSSVLHAETILVTTSTGEIGRTIAFTLAQEGYDLILLARNPEKLQRQINKLRYAYPNQSFEVIAVDYTNPDTIQGLGDMLKSRSLEGYVLMTPRPHFDDILLPDSKEWKTAFDANFIGPLETLKESLPALERGQGRIVVISGTTSKQVIPAYAAFGVIRNMWLSETKALSHLLGPKGVLINTISPGEVLTPSRAQGIEQRAIENQLTFEEQRDLEASAIPLQKYALPTDVAHAVAFFLDVKNSHITGANLVLDGGVTVAY